MRREPSERPSCACAYVLPGASRDSPFCGAALKPGSSYCATHHRLCCLETGSASEARMLEAVELIALNVGGRGASHAHEPPDSFLKRVERAARGSI